MPSALGNGHGRGRRAFRPSRPCRVRRSRTIQRSNAATRLVDSSHRRGGCRCELWGQRGSAEPVSDTHANSHANGDPHGDAGVLCMPVGTRGVRRRVWARRGVRVRSVLRARRWWRTRRWVYVRVQRARAVRRPAGRPMRRLVRPHVILHRLRFHRELWLRLRAAVADTAAELPPLYDTEPHTGAVDCSGPSAARTCARREARPMGGRALRP
jgi:hypothetical protein